MTPEELEALAIRAGRGDNVNRWPSRFNADQKKYWREFVEDLARIISEAEFKRGYAKCQEEYMASARARQSRDIRRMMGKR